MQTTRKTITFDSQGLKIFGVLHQSQDHQAPSPGVLILHGFVGSKDQPHRIFVSLAEALAQAGIAALRIDLPGRGDSEGETIDITVEGDMHATRRALDLLAARPDIDPSRLGMVGMSWGGAITSSIAGSDQRVSSLALWSCAPDELDWHPTFEEVDGREVQEVWGNLIGRQFYEGLHQINPIEDICHVRGPVLLAYGTADEIGPFSAVERAQQALDRAGLEYETIAVEGADHAFMRYTHKQELIKHTVAWLKRTLSRS